MKKGVKRFLSFIAALSFGAAFPLPFSPAAAGKTERIAVLDDEKAEYGGFCTSVTSEKVRFGAYAYKSSPGYDANDYWIIRTDLPDKKDFSEITENGKSGALRFWIYVEDCAEINNWNGSQAQLGKGWDKNAYVWSGWDTQITADGWNEIVLPFSAASHVGLPSAADITYFNLRTNNTSFKTTVYTDRICVCTDSAPAAAPACAMLQSCEQQSTLSAPSACSVSAKHAYEGGFSFFSGAENNDSWIICSNGTSPLNATDITPYLNGGLRFLIYVDDINAMGSVYRLALSSGGTALGDYWKNEDGGRTDTADVGYVWNSADISRQITRNGWNEVILPFKKAKMNYSATESETVYPYSGGVNLTELYFRNYVRSCDVYIDSIMLIADCENFNAIEPSYVKLSGLDEDGGRYTEGGGSLLLENETERFVSFERRDCEGDGFAYLRFMLYLPENGALPDVGQVKLYDGENTVCQFPSAYIAPQITRGWNEVFLYIRDGLSFTDGISFSADTEYWHNIRIDSLMLLTAAGNDCKSDYKQDETECNNISSGSEFSYTVLNPCEKADGMKKYGVAAATSEKRTEGTKSILSRADGDFILCSEGESPLKPFNPDTYGEKAAVRLLMYIDGETDMAGSDYGILLTDGSAVKETFLNKTARGFYWDSAVIAPQIKKANDWNEIVLPFSKAYKNSVSGVSCTDIFFYAAERTADIYIDFITAVSDLSFTERANSFYREKNISVIDGFDTGKPVSAADKALRFWIWVENKNDVAPNWGGSQLQLGEGWDKNVYVWSGWDTQITADGWNEIILPFGSAAKVGAPDNEHISYINIRSGNTKFKTTVYIDCIRISTPAGTAETYIDAVLNDESGDSGGFCAEISGEKSKSGSFSYKATPGAGNHDYWMIRTSLKKKINLEKTAGEPYQGISSLYLSAGAEYKKDFRETNLADGKYGGIQLWYRGSLKNAAPCGTVTLLHGENAVLSWRLADVLNSERLTDGWQSAYLSFEAAGGAPDYADALTISAETELKLDFIIFVSGYGDDTGEFYYTPTPGDANADGKFDIRDIVRAKKHSAYNSALDISVTDFDKDGVVTGSDIAYLKKLILGVEPDILPVSTVNPGTPTLVNGSDIALYDVISFGAKGDGISDDTPAFSAALQTAGKNGAAVYVPYGKYRLTSSLTIPANVSLTGQVCSDGTTPILMLYPKTVSEGNNTPFFRMCAFGTVEGFTIWYPEQTLSGGTVKAYPYTFSMVGWQSVTLQNLYIVNAYDAFDFELTPHNLETVRNIKATVLHSGMVWSGNNDIGRFENISISPEWWLKSSVTEKPNAAALYSRCRNNITALHIKSIDWHFVSTFEIYDCRTGVKADGGFGKFYGCNFVRCNTAVEFNSVAYYGTTFTNCRISATHGSSPAAVRLNENCKNNISFVSSEIFSAGKYAVENHGVTGVMLTGCRVSAPNAAAVLYTYGGKYGVSSSEFYGKKIAEQSPDAPKSTFSNITLNNSAVSSLPGINALTAYNGDDSAETPDVPLSPGIKKPAENNSHIFNAADFGVNENESDISASLQSAINAAAAAGGGTVFVPNGNYYLQNPVTVKKGVTLLGSHDAPHYSTAVCTSFITDYGKNLPDGTALITLETNSALRGLSVSYSETRLDSTPYAYTLRGTGSDIYIRNVAVDGAYRVLDLKTNRCDRHYVEYLLFSATNTGISIGSGSHDGTVRDCQSNVSQLWDNRFTDRNYWLNTVGTAAIINYLNGHFTGYEISDAVNQTFFMNFVYGANVGLKINGSADAAIIGQGVDYTFCALDIANNANVRLFESQLSCSSGSSVAIKTEKDFSGNLRLYNTAIWACRKNAMELNGGNTAAVGGVFFQGGSDAVYLAGGSAAFYGIAFAEHTNSTFNIQAGAEYLLAAGNCYKNFSYSNGSGIKLYGCDLN